MSREVRAGALRSVRLQVRTLPPWSRASALWLARAALSLLLLVMAIAVGYLLLARFSPDGVPSVLGYRFLIVVSGSMSPTFEAGDVVAVRRVDPRQIQPQEIITFRDPLNPRMLITHRVTAVGGQGSQLAFDTKGDANQVADRYRVVEGSVLGRVSFHVPYLGYLVQFARTPTGLGLFVIAPGMALIALELAHLRQLWSQMAKASR